MINIDTDIVSHSVTSICKYHSEKKTFERRIIGMYIMTMLPLIPPPILYKCQCIELIAFVKIFTIFNY